MIRYYNALFWILVPDSVKLLETKMRQLFNLLLLGTGTSSNVRSLLSVGAVPDCVEVNTVCLVVLLKCLFLVNYVLPLSRT